MSCWRVCEHTLKHSACSGLTDEVAHHLRRVVRRGSDAQQLFSASHRGVVNGLDVDVIAAHHDVTHLRVLLCVRHLRTHTSASAARSEMD